MIDDKPRKAVYLFAIFSFISLGCVRDSHGYKVFEIRGSGLLLKESSQTWRGLSTEKSIRTAVVMYGRDEIVRVEMLKSEDKIGISSIEPSRAAGFSAVTGQIMPTLSAEEGLTNLVLVYSIFEELESLVTDPECEVNSEPLCLTGKQIRENGSAEVKIQMTNGVVIPMRFERCDDGK